MDNKTLDKILCLVDNVRMHINNNNVKGVENCLNEYIECICDVLKDEDDCVEFFSDTDINSASEKLYNEVINFKRKYFISNKVYNTFVKCNSICLECLYGYDADTSRYKARIYLNELRNFTDGFSLFNKFKRI